MSALSRRNMLLLSAAASVTALGRQGFAQTGPIQLGSIVPLTGSGGSYGPSMAEAIKWVVQQVNAAGGIKGRQLNLTIEDDQTNPDSGVRAARKLIDVNQVIAIMGTWASSVTTAVAPLCWESRTFLTTTSGADRITQLPHQGYLIRTEPTSQLMMQKLGAFLPEFGVKRLFMVSAQTPFAEPSRLRLTEELRKRGSDVIGHLVYDRDKTSFRSEIDMAIRDKPDMIFLDGYTPDVTILLRDLYRTGYDGKKLSRAYAVNEKLLTTLPPDVTEGVMTLAPSPDVASPSYKALAAHLKVTDVDPYTSQVYDHASIVLLALESAKEATGTGIRDAVRSVTDTGGTVVHSAVEGLKLLRAGTKVKYSGVSGPCLFDPIGDILDTKVRYETVKAGKQTLLKIAG